MSLDTVALVASPIQGEGLGGMRWRQCLCGNFAAGKNCSGEHNMEGNTHSTLHLHAAAYLELYYDNER